MRDRLVVALVVCLELVAVLFLVLGLFNAPWRRGVSEEISWALLVLAPGLLPLIALWQVIWLDSEWLGVRSLLRSRRVPRHNIARIIGTVGGLTFIGRSENVLLITTRLWGDGEISELAAEIGIPFEGTSRDLSGPVKSLRR